MAGCAKAMLALPGSMHCHTGLKKATRRLRRVHELAAAATREVRAGGLAERLGGSGRARRRPRRPYSPWLAQPYAKVAARSVLATFSVGNLINTCFAAFPDICIVRSSVWFPVMDDVPASVALPRAMQMELPVDVSHH